MGLHCHSLPDNKIHRHPETLPAQDIELKASIEDIFNFATPLKYEERLRLEHSFVCDNGIINLQFSSQVTLELCEARQLLVRMVEGFLKQLNYGYNRRNWLYTDQLTANNLKIQIDFQSFYGVYVDESYIGSLTLEDGVSFFYAFDLKDRSLCGWHSKIEPYSTSLAIVNAQINAEGAYEQKHPKHSSAFSLEERHR